MFCENGPPSDSRPGSSELQHSRRRPLLLVGKGRKNCKTPNGPSVTVEVGVYIEVVGNGHPKVVEQLGWNPASNSEGRGDVWSSVSPILIGDCGISFPGTGD